MCNHNYVFNFRKSPTYLQLKSNVGLLPLTEVEGERTSNATEAVQTTELLKSSRQKLSYWLHSSFIRKMCLLYTFLVKVLLDLFYMSNCVPKSCNVLKLCSFLGYKTLIIWIQSAFKTVLGIQVSHSPSITDLNKTDWLIETKNTID